MDLEAFFAGVCAAGVGALITVLCTRKIEDIKSKVESAKAQDNIYLELSDLSKESERNICTVFGTYSKFYAFESGVKLEKILDNLSIPRPSQLLILKELLERCFSELSKEQRNSIRAVVYLVNQSELIINKLNSNAVVDLKLVKAKDLRFLLATFCALYHITLCLSQERERFKRIDKTPEELMSDVLESQGKSLEMSFLFDYVSKLENVA